MEQATTVSTKESHIDVAISVCCRLKADECRTDGTSFFEITALFPFPVPSFTEIVKRNNEKHGNKIAYG